MRGFFFNSMNHILIKFIIILFNIVLCNEISHNWKIESGFNDKTKRNYISLINKSTNEERITSERISGEFKIYCDGTDLKLLINWGEFANNGKGNIYYHMREYGLWEEDWFMSQNGQVSYSPDPLLLLMQLTTTDSFAIGIRPKYLNEIRYYFNNKGLSDIIRKNQDIFGEFSELINSVFNYSNDIEDKTYLKKKLQSFIFKENDTRSLRVNLFENDKFFFKPIWYQSKLLSSHHINSESNNIIYFNRWLKKKGTLFTDSDIRVRKFLSKKPTIIQYTDIQNVEVKGNKLIGYRIHINDKFFTTFSDIKKDHIEEIKNFIINRSKYSLKG